MSKKTSKPEPVKATEIPPKFEVKAIRQTRCRVVFHPKERIKDYFLEDAPADAQPVLVEDMTAEDFQVDLLEAESGAQKEREE